MSTGALRNFIVRQMQNTGSMSDPSSPALFRTVLGGPATGMALQAALLGGSAYGLRRLYGKITDEDEDSAKSGARNLGLLAALPAVGLNMPGLIHSVKEGGGINSDVYKLSKR